MVTFAGFLVWLHAVGAGATEVPSPWRIVAPLPEARQEVGVAALGGEIFVVGGLDGARATVSDVTTYDPVADSWRTVADMPVALHHPTVATLGSSLFLVGGLSGLSFQATAAVRRYDPVVDGWTSVTPMPTARGAHAAAECDGRIYAAGGFPAIREQDFAVYDPTTDSWTSLPDMPTPRNHLGAACVDGVFYAIGGRSGGLFDVTDAVESYNPATGVWSTQAPLPTARAGIAVAVVAGRIHVLGGEGNRDDPDRVFDEHEIFDPVARPVDNGRAHARPASRDRRSHRGRFALRSRGSTDRGFHRQRSQRRLRLVSRLFRRDGR